MSAGFDFLEVNVQSVLCGEVSDADWVEPELDRVGLPIEAANCLVPGHLKVVGPEREWGVLRGYMERVARRARRLGVGRLVFGSGAARNRPDGVDAQVAFDQIAEFLRMAGDFCEEQQIEVLVEHLCRPETNTVNTLGELKVLVDRAGHPRVGALLDSYHYGVEGELPHGITALGGSIRHVHVAEPVGRGQPGSTGRAGDLFDFASFFRVLRQAGYTDRVSVEANWVGSIRTEGPACVALLRALWDESEA